MILTKQQVEIRESSPDNIANQKVANTPTVIYKDGINNHKGKGTGVKNLSNEERVAIGVVASVTDDETAAAIFGIHKSHANDIKQGNRNVGNGESGSSLRTQDTALLNTIESRLEKTKLTIQERAAERLLTTLGLFESPSIQDKLENSTPKEVAAVVKDMSQVMRNLSDKQKDYNSGNTNVKIIVHAPKEANESSFDMIELRA